MELVLLSRAQHRVARHAVSRHRAPVSYWRLAPLSITAVAVIAAGVTGLLASRDASYAAWTSTATASTSAAADRESVDALRSLALASRDQQRSALAPTTSPFPTPSITGVPKPTATPAPTTAPIVGSFAPVPGCSAVVPASPPANGRLSTSQLCPIGDGQLLRADAAATFIALDAAYRAAFGSGICVTDSYRSYSSQVSLYAQKPSLAAVPGTSNHGWGVAVDVFCGIDSYGSAQHEWMTANAPAYGWTNPSWARNGGGREEPWHWEFDVSLLS